LSARITDYHGSPRLKPPAAALPDTPCSRRTA
jgi:hypothetical protein